jgi:PAS domain S-box-containing protein
VSSRPSRGAARLASILDALPDALLLVNANGTVVNANAIALETFETPGTALVGRGLLDLLPSFDPKRIPGSMRSPQEAEEDHTRTKPTRMQARRTDGSEFPAQVTSANLEDGRTPYAEYGDGVPHYTGDELLMLVVRDLSGTVDTEAELARQQRQTEMILRAAAEGVVGVDTAGKIVLVNPSAAQILGFRATDLGGKELHPLVHHSRADGSPLAYEETPLADTLRSGRKHRVRGQVLWRKDGKAVPVDLTTAPVRDGDQLVGAVMTFTDRTQYDAMDARTEQLRSLLDTSLRGPLAELRGELTGLAADPAGQLWPEANQILHHLSAGYARITTLIDNVLSFQRLDRGEERLHRTLVGLDEVVAAAVEGATELIGPGRAQFAVHAAPIEASVDAPRMAQALAHLVADVAGVDSAGNAIAFSGDSTIVVAAAQRGDVVRIDVRGPSAGGDPVHVPLARGIVEHHGGVLQTHEVPGQGSAYVLEVPLGTDPDRAARTGESARGAHDGPARGGTHAGGTAPSGAGPDAGSDSGSGTGSGSGSRRGTDAASAQGAAPRPPRPRQHMDDTGTVVAPWMIPAAADQSEAPTGRRRALRRPTGADEGGADEGGAPPDEGVRPPTGRRARRGRPAEEERRPEGGERLELPAAPIPNALPPAGNGARGDGQQVDGQQGARTDQGPGQGQGQGGQGQVAPGTGRRARRALEAAAPPAGPADPRREGPADGRPQQPAPSTWPQAAGGSGPSAPRREGPAEQPRQPRQPSAPTWPEPGRPSLPSQPGPTTWPTTPRNDPQAHASPADPQNPQNPQAGRAPSGAPPNADRQGSDRQGPDRQNAAHQNSGQQGSEHQNSGHQNAGPQGRGPRAQDPSHQSHGRAISVRTLGQGVPFGTDPRQQTQTQAVQAQHPQGLPAQVAAGGSGRRRRLAAPGPPPQEPPQLPNQSAGPGGENQARQHPQADPDSGQLPVRKPSGPARDDRGTAPLRPVPAADDPRSQAPGRSYAIGAPAEGAAEGPEPLDGPNGAVDVTDVADDRQEEPLDEPRRLLVWPEPDISTRQALTDRGYRPVIVRSREEVDAQVAEPPAALFVDPLTGPITRTALQSLRQAAAAADVPVLVTAGLGQATREAAYGADPAVLLKALAPRDSEQHPPRVLLVESHDSIALAFAATLERRGMQVTHADSESDAMTKAAQIHPNLVVMDLMLIRRRRQGIVDWLRGNSRLKHTPLVVYTSAGIDPAELPRLASGETVLFLAERSTSTDVQSRIVDLLGKIGA